MRKHGLSIDQLVSVDLVTAEGELTQASAGELTQASAGELSQASADRNADLSGERLVADR
jgi:hypothetical protein